MMICFKKLDSRLRGNDLSNVMPVQTGIQLHAESEYK
jgi:hypothetical protein